MTVLYQFGFCDLESNFVDATIYLYHFYYYLSTSVEVYSGPRQISETDSFEAIVNAFSCFLFAAGKVFKYGPEITPYLDTFYAVIVAKVSVLNICGSSGYACVVYGCHLYLNLRFCNQFLLSKL